MPRTKKVATGRPMTTNTVAGRGKKAKVPAPPPTPSEHSEQEEEDEEQMDSQEEEEQEEDQENTTQEPTSGNATNNDQTTNTTSATSATNNATKKSKKPKKKEDSKKSKSKSSKKPSYSNYIHKVMKQVHPDMTISSKGMIVMNSMNVDMFERICNEAASLTRYSKKNTMSFREIETAAKLILPGELSKHAVSESQKAVRAYLANTEKA